MLFLALFQSTNSSSPCFILSSLSSKMSSCQEGDGILSAFLHKSSQIVSIVRIFSSIDIFSKEIGTEEIEEIGTATVYCISPTCHNASATFASFQAISFNTLSKRSSRSSSSLVFAIAGAKAVLLSHRGQKGTQPLFPYLNQFSHLGG